MADPKEIQIKKESLIQIKYLRRLLKIEKQFKGDYEGERDAAIIEIIKALKELGLDRLAKQFKSNTGVDIDEEDI